MKYGTNGTINYSLAMKTVYDMMIPVFSTIATLPSREANKRMDTIKEKKLFPLKYEEELIPKYNLKNLTLENKILTILKNKCFTRTGYTALRVFRKILKIKRKLIK